MISCSSLSLFGVNGDAILVNVSFAVKSGEAVALTGPSGCGKSTLLRAVCGGVERWQGEISVAGMALMPASVGEIRTSIGYIPQEPRLPDLTVAQYLEGFYTAVGKRWSKTVLAEVHILFETVILPLELLEQNCRRLSGGQRQRVAIVAVLLLGRQIVLADEITSALDSHAKLQVMDLLFSRDATMLSVSHDADWLARCDRVLEVRELQEACHG